MSPVKLGLTTAILPAGEAAVAEAARCLGKGGLVAFPTETVYGLGADATNPAAVALLQAFGKPVVAPSANLSGRVSPTTASHVESDLWGRIDLIIDGGPVEVGVESTIVGCFAQPMLLRPGGVPRAEIERVLG